MGGKALGGQTQHCLRREAVRRITVLGSRLNGPEVERALAVHVGGCISKNYDVVLRRKVRMLNCKLVVAFDGDSRQAEGFEARGKARAETVVTAAGIAATDDENARDLVRSHSERQSSYRVTLLHRFVVGPTPRACGLVAM